ncbi:SH3 domain-containing protein [Desulfobaculum sp. SPO524]|uniref:SH3 domain-containing protein n=1 Tax=Desulfobaculum sp. SPO524 TaxID=3378071 RepID=UPI00385436CD
MQVFQNIISRGCWRQQCAALLVLAAMLCGGCASMVSPPAAPGGPAIRDEAALVQRASAYVDAARAGAPLMPPDVAKKQAAYFLERWFAPWHRSAPETPAEKVFAYLHSADPGALYGEDTRVRGARWLSAMRHRSAVEEYPNAGYAAIMVRAASMRVLPTARPAYHNPAQAGQGWPFDTLQNSAVWAQTPVYVSHISRNGAWVFVEAPFAYGWVPASSVVPVDGATCEGIENGPHMAIVRDEVPIRGTGGLASMMGRIGMILPVVHDAEGRAILGIIRSGAVGQGVLTWGVVDADAIAPFPLTATPQAVARIADQMLGDAYGWGGVYANRDCSSTMMDLFAPFGLRLPRNSLRQAEAGRFVSFEGLDRAGKRRRIAETARPWMTLLWQPGHIMLYIGTAENGEAVMLHNMWGLRTREASGAEGRHVVGRCVITTLTPGAEVPGLVTPQGLLLERMGGMSLLPTVVPEPREDVAEGAPACGHRASTQ